jgi:vitamin B12 transporter
MRSVVFVASPRGVAVLASTLLLSFVTYAPAHAQGGNQSSTIALPAIDVTSATLIPTPASQVASSVTVITAGDLEREQRRTVPDALKTVPGLNVVQTGGPGGQTSVFMRGTNANHVKVFIDGIDAGDPSSPNGAFDFAHLLTGDIERIEVLRGPQSGLYGSDAIGGVISITTKRGEGPPKATGTLEGGSFGTFNQKAGLSGSEGRFDYAFNVQHFRSTSTPVTPLELLAPGDRRNNDTYDNWTYSTRVGAKVSDEFSVGLVTRYTEAKVGFTGDNFSLFPAPPTPEALQSTVRNQNLFTRGEAVWMPFNGFKNVFGVGYSNLRNVTVNPNPDFFAPPPVVPPPTTNVGTRTKFDWRGEANVAPGQILVLGLEHQKDTIRTDSTGIFDPVTFNFVQTTTLAETGNKAGYVELQSEFDKRFSLVTNIRHDVNDTFGGHTTWRAAPVFIVPVTETKLKGSYGTGFKAPTLTQLFVSNPSFGFIANPGLLPESSKGYDAGFEQLLLNNRIGFGATYFNNDIKNLINFTPFDPVTFTSTLQNVGLANTHGLESFVALVVTDRFKVRSDYTRTFTRDETTGLGLQRRPRDKISVTSVWNPIDGLALSTTLLHVSSWVDIGREGTPPRLDAPAFTTVNLAANYDIDKHVSVFARADNLFNRQYQSIIGFLSPGLGVFGGVRVTN